MGRYSGTGNRKGRQHARLHYATAPPLYSTLITPRRNQECSLFLPFSLLFPFSLFPIIHYRDKITSLLPPPGDDWMIKRESESHLGSRGSLPAAPPNPWSRSRRNRGRHGRPAPARRGLSKLSGHTPMVGQLAAGAGHPARAVCHAPVGLSSANRPTDHHQLTPSARPVHRAPWPVRSDRPTTARVLAFVLDRHYLRKETATWCRDHSRNCALHQFGPESCRRNTQPLRRTSRIALGGLSETAGAGAGGLLIPHSGVV